MGDARWAEGAAATFRATLPFASARTALRMRIPRPLLSLMLLAASAGSPAGHAWAQQAETLAGTYRIAICRGPCEPGDSARALAWGVLVLNHGAIPRARLPADTQELELLMEGRGFNACFALDARHNAPTMAGVEPAALTRWGRRGEEVQVPLFRSPDSGYEAELRVTPRGLRGRGRSWGIDQGSIQLPDDSVVAQRTGPPNPSLCVAPASARKRIADEMAQFDSAMGAGRPQDKHPETMPAPPFAFVTAAGNRTCALTGEGVAYCWGDNNHGLVGDGTQIDRLAAVPVDGGLRFRALSVGDGHACALADDGQAYCWGANWFGELGTRTDSVQKTPVAVAGGLRFASISAGGGSTCALTADGVAYCWGLDRHGQLGDGPTPRDCTDAGGPVECRWTPTPVAGGLRFRALQARGVGACGITVQGQAYCWGEDIRHARTRPSRGGEGIAAPRPVPGAPSLTFLSPPQGLGATCALDPGGAAWCWKRGTDAMAPVAEAQGHSFVALALGHLHTCGLEAGGALLCWGSDFAGQLGRGLTSWGDHPPAPVLARK